MMLDDIRIKKLQALSEFLFIAFAAVFSVYFLPLGVDAHHDGYLFNMALNIRRGGTIYVDYTNIYGPLTAYTHALFMGVFGDTLYAMRLSAIPFLLASLFLYYRIFIRWLPHGYALFSQALLLLVGTGFNTGWSSIYALAFALLAAEEMLKYLESGKMRWFVLSAVFAAVAFLYRQPAGFCIILAGLCSLVFMGIAKAKKWREIGRLALVYCFFVALAFAPIVLLFCAKGCLSAWWKANVVILFAPVSFTGLRQESMDAMNEMAQNILPLGNLSAFAGRLISAPAFGKIFKLAVCLFPIYPFNSQIIWLVLPIVSIITFLAAFFKLAKNKAEDRAAETVAGVLAIYALAAWGQYYPSGNHLHWYCSCFIMYGILMRQIWKLGRKVKNEKAACVLRTAVPLVLAGQVCYFSYFASDINDMNAKLLGDTSLNNKIYSMKYHNVVYKGGYGYLKGIRMSRKQADFYDGINAKIAELLQEYPDAVVEMPYPPFNILGTFGIDTRGNKGNVRIVIDGIENAENHPGLQPVYSRRVDYKSESYLEKNGDVVNVYVKVD